MMKTILCLLVCICVFMLSCGDNDSTFKYNTPDVNPTSESPTGGDPEDPLIIEIRDIEAKAKYDTVIDRNKGLRLLKAYQDYYNKHTKDSLGLAFLFEAARVADAMGKYDKAIDLLLNYHEGEQNLNKKSEAAYLVAFIYDAHLHNAKKAMEYYNKVIELYPQTTWAQQSKDALHLVGKSDEELLKFLEEKNKPS